MYNASYQTIAESAPSYGLSTAELAKIAPSIYTREPDSSRSQNYSLYNTEDIVDRLREFEFVPTWACQCKGRSGYTSTGKHMLRFSRIDDLRTLSPMEERPELVLVNSHNGSSSYRFMAGIFRLVCSNGMILSSASYADIRVRHIGHSMDEVIAASAKVAGTFEGAMESVKSMKSTFLTDSQIRDFAVQAAILRCGEDAYKEGKIVTPQNLLITRRKEDEGNSLWNVLNTVQENMLKGGVRLTKRNIRPIKGVDNTVNLNTKLWELAESYQAA